MLQLVPDREKIDIFLDKLLTLHHPEQKKNMPAAIATGAALGSAMHLVMENGTLT